MEWLLKVHNISGFVYHVRVIHDSSPVPSGALLNKLDHIKAKLGLGLWK